MCEKLVQSASLYSHRIMRINALQGRLVWARIRDETEESLLNTVGGGALSKTCVCLYERMRIQVYPVVKLSMKVIYEHVNAHVCRDLCMQRWA